jgi:hypothetical protein
MWLEVTIAAQLKLRWNCLPTCFGVCNPNVQQRLHVVSENELER